MTLDYGQIGYAAVVARVSGRDQQKKGTSLETQVEECCAAARLDGYHVPQEYIFRDVETGAHSDRAGLENALGLGRQERIQRIYVHNYDRLSRNELDMLNILRDCEEVGVRLVFVTGPSDTSPEGQLMMFILGYSGRRERAQFIERTNRSKRKIALEEGRMATGDGVGMYGTYYDKVLQRRVTIPEEAAIVVWMFNRRLARISYYGIACELNEMGIPSKTGKKWTGKAVKRILTNRAYTGKHAFLRREVRKVRVGKETKTIVTFRPESETIMVENHTPEIIPPAVYEEVQKLDQAPQVRKRNGQKQLLTGFVQCLTCGGPVTLASRTNSGRYYRCRRALNTRLNPATCKEPNIRQDELEPAVWAIVSDAVRNPDILVNEIRQFTEEEDDGSQQAEMKRLEREVNDLRQQQIRLMAERGKAHIDPELLEYQIAPVKLLYDQKKEQLAILEEQKVKKEQAADAGEVIRQYCAEMKEALETLDTEDKRKLLSAFQVEVEATLNDMLVSITVDPGVTISPSKPLAWESTSQT